MPAAKNTSLMRCFCSFDVTPFMQNADILGSTLSALSSNIAGAEDKIRGNCLYA